MEKASGIARQRCLPDGEGYKTRYNREEEGEVVEPLFLQCFSIYTDMNGYSLLEMLRVSPTALVS